MTSTAGQFLDDTPLPCEKMTAVRFRLGRCACRGPRATALEAAPAANAPDPPQMEGPTRRDPVEAPVRRVARGQRALPISRRCR